MGHEAQDVLIKDFLVFLVAAGLVVPVLRLVRLPSVAGFILAGLALGPYGLGSLADSLPPLGLMTLSDPDAATPFAELGVLFLLFLLGLELSVEKLWALRRVVFGAGLFQVVCSAGVLAAICVLLGLTLEAAVIAGLALALSSTAIVMQLLVDSREATGPVGRAALGVLLLQDLLVAPILIFIGFTAQEGGPGLASVLFEALAQGFVALAVIVVIGRYLLRHLFHLAARAGGRDFLMAITLLTVVGAAVITASAGLSIALGAFMAGLLVGETEFKHQAEVDLEPFKGLLLGVFFMTVGLGLDLPYILENIPVILGGLFGLLVIKATLVWIAARLFAGGAGLASETAGLLAPAGEFAFVILAAAGAVGLMPAEPATIMTAMAGLSMLLVPLTWRAGRLVHRLLGRRHADGDTAAEAKDQTGHVLIGGFGRVGQAVAAILEREQAIIVGLDTQPGTVARERRKGRQAYLGDGAREEILIQAGLAGAMLVIVTLDDPDSAERMVRAARRRRPDVPILARAKDADHAHRLMQAGASHVIPDAIEAGLQMSARALEQYGYGTETVRDIIAAERDEAYAMATQDQT
jgi:CPA2 family monovalent cation:H+ antiporter-2